MNGNQRMRRLTVLALLGMLVLAVVGADGGGFDAKTLLATAGLGMIVAAAKYVWDRQHSSTRWRYRVDTALWGDEDAAGDRHGGLVGGMAELQRELPTLQVTVEQASLQAATAADAARQSQRLILEAIADLKKERTLHQERR